MPIKSPFSKALSICSRTSLLLIATVLPIQSISLTASGPLLYHRPTIAQFSNMAPASNEEQFKSLVSLRKIPLSHHQHRYRIPSYLYATSFQKFILSSTWESLQDCRFLLRFMRAFIMSGARRVRLNILLLCYNDQMSISSHLILSLGL